MRLHGFESMGCEIVVGGATGREVLRIEELVRERDARFSRFRPDSELNRVNGAGRAPVRISPDFEAMLRLAVGAAARTGGLVDPTLGQAIEAAGYDRDFSHLEPVADPAAEGRPGRWRALRVAHGWLSRPPGVLLDLNGVAKAKTVDDALALLGGDGFVSAGGDLAARGAVDVELPGGETVRVLGGGLATSGTRRRRWLRAGRRQHHLIDAVTGAPSDSPWEEVTVSARSCLQADVAAKAAFLLGLGGPAWLDGRRLPGRFVIGGGKALSNLSWRRALADHREAA